MEMERTIMIDTIPKDEVFQEDKRNTKKMMLPTDAICANCGVIFNSVYEDECVICDDYREIKNEIKNEIKEEIKDIEKPVIRFVEDKKDSKDKDKEGDEVCEHTDFIL